ncbi:hypothetical protein TNCV_557131 [Trichonephila clavipes]|uniref:Uncharacterized protein n=1 Tax=Trichonephila clavipes TaxID=2585209 RepID=A0A8X6RLR1_TRICX|nr:hypothetical protein TNCV_557131 [Trichonephila clavipes]
MSYSAAAAQENQKLYSEKTMACSGTEKYKSLFSTLKTDEGCVKRNSETPHQIVDPYTPGVPTSIQDSYFDKCPPQESTFAWFPRSYYCNMQLVYGRITKCKVLRNLTIEEWKQVLWKMELRYSLYQLDNIVRAWRMSGEHLFPECIVSTAKFGSGGIIV